MNPWGPCDQGATILLFGSFGTPPGCAARPRAVLLDCFAVFHAINVNRGSAITPSEPNGPSGLVPLGREFARLEDNDAWFEPRQPDGATRTNRARSKKKTLSLFWLRVLYKNRQYLLSRLQHYHRLKVLNYCVRDGNRCDHFDMVTGRTTSGLFTQTTLCLHNLQLKLKWLSHDDPKAI